ncbi:MAG: WD40/YVTN/BNR-like repeat-containing protein, partial [Isosphaerales bacterium]
MKTTAILLGLALAAIGLSQGYDPANYSNLQWVNVGPNRGGRSVACTGVRTRPKEYYFGATGGGLWKSTDSGQSWSCVTDGFLGSSSVGAIAVSDSTPDTLYIGMGERDIRGDISEGDGVYKSTDAGKTWTHVGLENTKTVSRIVVDPKNPDVVYVAALGHVYGPSPDRGVYKSTDGGKTWSKVLFESEKAGAVELIMDPADSNTLYAATWEAWRTPYFLNSGGPGSKMWKTTDAGAHWTDITRNPGLPAGVIGKIGITVAASNHLRVYANIEAKEGGIFKSDDAGATWTRVSDDSEWRQRAWYYTHVYADPKNADKLYCLNVGAGVSTNGGKTWTGFRPPHGDNHDLWINPDDPSRMIESNDGGASVSSNGGDGWSRQSYPTAAIYHVVADNHVPYKIYGAQQDNSSVMLSPSDPDTPEKRNFQGTAGGESGFIAVRWDDPDVVFGGNYSGDISEINYRTKVNKRIDPWPDNPMGHGAVDLKHRIQWTFPIVTSPHDPNVLYTASQYLLKTDNDGQSWQQISPDLTRNDKSKQGSSGGPLTQDNTSIEYYDTIFAVAESPLKKGLIWVGSDDGLIHVTQDGGKSWQNVTPKEMPKWGRVSMVEASRFFFGTAYVAVNNYQNGEDLAPYIYRTRDCGKTWTKIVNGMNATAFARVCREDLHRPGLLYAGTETGAYVSFDDGDHWQSLQQNMPLCPVHDLFLKDDDLIAATHGRSFWIMHGVSRLAELTPSKPVGPLLLQPVDRVRTGFGGNTGPVDYYLPAKAGSVEFTFTSASGEKLGTAKGDTDPGFHNVTASLSHPGFGTFPGMVFWSGFSRPIPAPPGTYKVEMTVDGAKQTKNLRLLKDPRVPGSEKDLQEQYAFAVQVSERVNDANKAVVRIRDMKTQIDRAIGDSKNDAGITSAGNALKEKLTGIEGEIHQYRSKSGEDPLNFPVMLNDRLAGLVGFVLSGQMRPPQQARDVFAGLTKALDVQLSALKSVEGHEVPAFNAALKAKGITEIIPKTP